MPRYMPPRPSPATSLRTSATSPDSGVELPPCSSCRRTLSTSKGQMAMEVKTPVTAPSATSVLTDGRPSSSTPSARRNERCTVMPTEFSAKADERAGSTPR
eukprot:scaffold14938_cov130-Isochrysis_galbana.AAC.11